MQLPPQQPPSSPVHLILEGNPLQTPQSCWSRVQVPFFEPFLLFAIKIAVGCIFEFRTKINNNFFPLDMVKPHSAIKKIPLIEVERISPH